MRDKRLLLLMALVFLLVLALLFFFRGLVVSVIVEPLLYLFWLGNLILESIDQRYLWWFLLGVMVIIMVRGLMRQQRGAGKNSRSGYQPRQTQRVSFWNTRIRRMASGTYPDEYSKHEFRKLILDVLAYRLNLSSAEVERSLKNGELELPEDIQAAFLQNNGSPAVKGKAWSSRLLQRFKKMLDRDESLNSQKVNQQIEELILYLNKQLEINREH